MEKIVQKLNAAAEMGHSSAQNNLAVFKKLGIGMSPDHIGALTWYRKAAAGGHLGAMFSLGLLLEQGCGATRNLDDAFKWFLEAAERGHARAQCIVATCYRQVNYRQRVQQSALKH
jgi:hypothetical protein